MLKLKEIQSIIKDFEESSLTILEIESADVKLKLSKVKEPAFEQKQTTTVVEHTTAGLDVNTPTPQTTEQKIPTVPIKSPLVGTFYESSTPNGKPFVKVGDPVKKGQVVCIVEAMKIMNEITSPTDGKIEAVYFKNGDVVGYDETLFTVIE
jgi:acetyl-CoA carboxylase biotin carboxyl carrier protein